MGVRLPETAKLGAAGTATVAGEFAAGLLWRLPEPGSRPATPHGIHRAPRPAAIPLFVATGPNAPHRGDWFLPGRRSHRDQRRCYHQAPGAHGLRQTLQTIAGWSCFVASDELLRALNGLHEFANRLICVRDRSVVACFAAASVANRYRDVVVGHVQIKMNFVTYSTIPALFVCGSVLVLLSASTTHVVPNRAGVVHYYQCIAYDVPFSCPVFWVHCKQFLLTICVIALPLLARKLGGAPPRSDRC